MRRMPISSALSLWSGIVMILVVVAGAIAILFTNAFDDRLYGNKRIFFVVLLLSYAVYRVFRVKQLLKNRDETAE
jgi:hypothetical protein